MNALKKSWMLYLCILCGWTSVSVDAKQDDKTAGRYTLSLDGGAVSYTHLTLPTIA